jgi:hypothetical protein
MIGKDRSQRAGQEANLKGANLKDVNLKGAVFRSRDTPLGADPTDILVAVFGREYRYRTSKVFEAQRAFSSICLRINVEPLVLSHLARTLSMFTELFTKCWLLSKGRVTDFVTYSQTHAFFFEDDAALVLTQVTYNSPINFEGKFDASATNVAEALHIGP